MKINLSWLFAAVLLFQFSAPAQVTNVALFKVTVFNQTSGEPPVAPNFPYAYYFGAQLNMYVPDYYQLADVIWQEAPPTSPAYNLNLPSTGDYNFADSVPFYATKASFDADFGPGTYEFDGTITNPPETDSAYVTLPTTEYYPTNIPALTAESWNRMQYVNPACDLSLNLNYFDVVAGADLALTFVDVFNTQTPGGSDFYNTNNDSPDLTNFIVPANTLLYGATYEVDIYFSSRLVTADVGFNGADGIVGFDYLTFADLVTMPPPLQIAPLGTNVVVSWPSLASNFNLQSCTNLANPFGWSFLTNVMQPPGLTNLACFPATGPACFYRLAQAAP